MANDGVAHFPPGAPAPTAAQREAERVAKLRDPNHLAKLNAARQEWLDKPKEERAAIIKERKAEKARRAAEREARRAAKRGGRSAAVAPEELPEEPGPDTVRSVRTTMAAPPPSPRSGEQDSPPESYRPMVGPVRGLLDLCASMPSLGDGSVFIQVTRVKPTTYQAVPCAGPQQVIWEPMDDAQFSLIYGGGEYSLRGYQTRDDRSPRPITEPVAYKSAGHPNLESLITEEDSIMQRPMRPNGVSGHVPGGIPRRGVVTPHVATAEAEMHDRDLTHQETMDQRNAERLERRRQREEDEIRRRDSASTEAIRILAESRDKEAERMTEMLRESRAGRGELSELLPLLQGLMPRGEDSKELVRQHAHEIKQLTESHKEEVLRLTEQQSLEIRRLSEQHQQMLLRLEDQVRADRERADGLIRETERRANESVREAERRSDGRVQDVQNAARSQYDDLRTRGEERLSDLSRSWEARFNDARDNHARELKRKDDEIALMRSNLEGNMNVILNGKDNEIKRLQHEVREAKAEAEKNKDWVGKIGEFEKQAEALGFTKDAGGDGEGGEESTKSLLIKGGIAALQQLPQMIQSGAAALSQIRGGGNPSDAARARPGAVRSSMRTVPRAHAPMQLQLPFGTEDSDIAPMGLPSSPLRSRPPAEMPLALEQDPVAPEPQYAPMPMPVAPPPAAHHVPQAAAEMPQLPQPGMVPAPEAMAAPAAPAAAPPAAAAPAPSMPPAPMPSVAPPAPPSTSGLGADAVQLMDQLMPEMNQAFEAKAAPKGVAQQFIDATSADVVRHILSMASIEQVLAHINSNPGAYGNLSTRAGQKFLREVWRAAHGLTGGEA